MARNKKLDKTGLAQVWSKITEKFVGKNTVLNTTEQISANTKAENIAGALALKEVMTDYNNKINQANSNLIIYRTWQYLLQEENIIIKPHEAYYFNIKRPVIEGYTCIAVSLQEKHGARNGYALMTYDESLGTIYNPTDADIYIWGLIFKFVYLKR